MKLKLTCLVLAVLALPLCVNCRVDQRGCEVVDEESLDMAYGIYVADSRVYVTTNDGVEIYAKQPSGKLRHLESVDVGAPCFTITVEGDRAYIGGEGGMTGLQLAADGPAAITGRCGDVGKSIYRILVEDTLIFVLDYEQGVTIVATSDAATFRTIGRLELPQGSFDMKRVRNTLYLANIARGLLVIDISDPSKPVMIAPAESSRGARSVHISRDTLFLGTFNHGVKIYDLADPVRPVLLDSLFQTEEVGVFHVEDGLLYCLWPERGVSVHKYDSRPLQEIAHFTTGLYHDGACVDDLLYFVGRGVHVLRLTQ